MHNLNSVLFLWLLELDSVLLFRIVTNFIALARVLPVVFFLGLFLS
jgi:hypothetical protein